MRTPEQEAQWQAAGEKIAGLLAERDGWFWPELKKQEEFLSVKGARYYYRAADAILALDGIEVRDKDQTIATNHPLAIDDLKGFVRVVPKE